MAIQKTDLDFRVCVGSTTQRNSLSAEDGDLRGLLYFDIDEQAIYLETTRAENDADMALERVCGNVKDVKWDNNKATLTVIPFSGSAVTIDLSTAIITDVIATINNTLTTLNNRVTALEQAEVIVEGNLVTPDEGEPNIKYINFSAKYWSSDKTIRFYNTETPPNSDTGMEIAEIDATAFIKDGMVDNVSFDNSTNILTITFNTDSGMSSIPIDMSALVDIYTADNEGLTVSDNQFALSLTQDGLLKKSASGLEVDKSKLLTYLKQNVVVSIASEQVQAEYDSDVSEDVQLRNDDIFAVTKHTSGTNAGTTQVGINYNALLAGLAKEASKSGGKVVLNGVTITGHVNSAGELIVTFDAAPKWYEVG